MTTELIDNSRRINRIYNLRPSLEWVSHPENRVSAHPFAATNFPGEFNTGESDAEVDQTQLGGCTANQMMALLIDLGIAPALASRLAQYYWERQREGTTTTDAGATIADTVWVAQNLGFIPETEWPYDISKFAVAPTPQMVADAAKNKGLIKSTMLQSDVVTQKSFIYNGDGKFPLPVIYGFAVYNQFESVGKDGNVAMPSGAILGGHANRRRGWSDSHRNLDGSLGAWRTDNCWGMSWGDGGKCWLPYNYPIWDVWGIAPVTTPAPIPVPPTPIPTPTPNKNPTLRDVSAHVTVRPDGSLWAAVTAQDATSGHNYSGGTTLA